MLWTWLARIDKRLWLALALSIALHFLLVAGSEGWLPSWLPDDEPLEVTLALLPPPVAKPIPPPVVAKPEPRQIRPAKPTLPPATPPPAAPPPVTAEPLPQSVADNDQITTTQTDHTTVQDTTPVQTATPPEIPVAAEQPEPYIAPAEVAEPPRPSPPKHVEIEFLVDYDGAKAVERQNYQAYDDGRYTVSSNVQAKGLLSLALSDLNQKSSGHITAQGLQPDTFVYQYGSNAKKAQKASFDWVGKTLTMEVGSSRQTEALEDGTQDMLSFLYQFMFTPPLDQFQLTITNGKQLKIYHYQFEGEEEVATKLGTLRALHISKSGSKGDEKTEFWLAEDYHYLPIKIRKTNSDGKVIQNTINSLKIDAST